MNGEEQSEGVADNSVWSDKRPRKPEEDIVRYIQSIGASLDTLDDAEAKMLLVQNVFEEIANQEASLASNKKCSSIVEKLLILGNTKQRCAFLYRCKGYFGFLCYNRYGSHVVETCISLLFNVQEETSSEDIPTPLELIESLVQHFNETNQWLDLMYDTSATHIVRSLIGLLGGEKYKSNTKTNRNYNKTHNNDNKVDSSDENNSNRKLFASTMMNMLDTVSEYPPTDLQEIAFNVNACPVLQMILKLCNPKLKQWKIIVFKLLNWHQADPSVEASAVNNDQFNKTINDRIASHVLEVILTKCTNKVYNILYISCFQNQIVQFASHKISNYVVQHLLINCRKEKQMVCLLDELEPAYETIFRQQYLGVLWKLCEKIIEYQNLQKRTCRAILKAVKNINKENKVMSMNVVEYLCGLTDVKQDDPHNDNKISINGCYIAGCMVRFDSKHNRSLLEQLTSLSPAQLVYMMKDPVAGRHVIEPLVESAETNLWAKQKLLHLVEPSLVALALDKFGYHTVRKFFDNCATKDKLAIATALSKAESKLVGSNFGEKLTKYFKLQQFRRQPEDWKASIQQKHQKKRSYQNWLEKEIQKKKVKR